MSLKLTVLASIIGLQAGSNDLSTPHNDISINERLALVNGVAAGEADLIWSDTRTLAASASENLDLAGALVDAFGATLTFVKVKAILIKAHAANTNAVQVGGAASNGFFAMFGASTDRLSLPPGAMSLIANDGGYAVVASTGDLLKIANGGAGTGVTYDIVIVGTSA